MPERAARPPAWCRGWSTELGGWREVRRLARRRPRRCACTAAATRRRATRRRSPTTTTSPTRFYRLVLGPSMTYSCAVFARPGRLAGGGPGDQVRADLPQARPRSPACGCSTSAAAGAAWPCTPPSTTACRRSASRSRSGRPSWPRSGWPTPGLSDRVEIRLQDYREVDDGPFDAISSIGMFEHVGEARLGEYFGRLRGAAAAAGPPAQPRHQPPAGPAAPPARPQLRRTATCSPTASCTRSAGWCRHPGRRASRSATSRRSASTTPSPCASGSANLEANWDEAVAEVGAGPGPGVAALHGRVGA